MMPATAIAPPRNRAAERVDRAGLNRPDVRSSTTRAVPTKKQIAQAANVAQYCTGERSVMASRTLETGANKSYSSGVRRVAASGAAPVLTSTNGDDEKTAVITSIPVNTSGHRYRDACRSLSVCKSSVESVQPRFGCVRYAHHLSLR